MLVGLLAATECHRLHTIVGLQFVLNFLTFRAGAVLVIGRNVVIELNHNLNTIQVNILGLCRHGGHQEPGGQQSQRDRRRNNHGDSHRHVTGQPRKCLAKNESSLH